MSRNQTEMQRRESEQIAARRDRAVLGRKRPPQPAVFFYQEGDSFLCLAVR